MRIIGHNGSPIAQHRISYSPREVPRTFTDSVRDAWATTFVKARFVPSPAEARDFAADSIFIPRTQPPVDHVLIDHDYRAWVRESNLGNPTARWLILSPDGTRAALDLPTDFRIVAARGSEVWVAETDKFDVPYLVRSRLTPR